MPFPSPGDRPNPGIKPRSPALLADFLLTELQGKPHNEVYQALIMGCPGSSAAKESTCNAGHPSLIPGLGISPVEKNRLLTPIFLGFPGDLHGKESTCNSGDLGSIPGLGKSAGRECCNLFQYSCLENAHGQKSLAGYSPWGHKESGGTEQLSTAQHKHLWSDTVE